MDLVKCSCSVSDPLLLRVRVYVGKVLLQAWVWYTPRKGNVLLIGVTVVLKVVASYRTASEFLEFIHISVLFRFCCLCCMTYTPVYLGKVSLVYNKHNLYVIRYTRRGWLL